MQSMRFWHATRGRLDVIVGDENTLIVEPLAVDFHVDEARRKVKILFVWLIDYLNGPDLGH
jgi:hypothetical protein